MLNLLYVCSITLQQSTGQAAIIKDEGPFCICLYQCNTRISRTKNLLLGPKNYQKRQFESGLRFGSNCCPLGWRDCALFAIFEFIHNAADYVYKFVRGSIASNRQNLPRARQSYHFFKSQAQQFYILLFFQILVKKLTFSEAQRHVKKQH